MARSIASYRPRREIRLILVLSITLVFASLWMLATDSGILSASNSPETSASSELVPLELPRASSIGNRPLAIGSEDESPSSRVSWLGWDLSMSGGLHAFPSGSHAFPSGSHAFPSGSHAFPSGSHAFPSGSIARQAYYEEPERHAAFNEAISDWKELHRTRTQDGDEASHSHGDFPDLRISPNDDPSLLLPPPSPEEARQQIIIDIADLRARSGGGISALLPQTSGLDEEELVGSEYRESGTAEETPQEQFDDALERVVRSRTEEVVLDPRGIVIFQTDQAGDGRRPDFAPSREPSRLENTAPLDSDVVRQLRETSRLVDERAAAAEDLEQYELADRLRDLADHLRAEARVLSGGASRIGRRYDARWAY